MRHAYEVCPWCNRSDGSYWVYPEGWLEISDRQAVEAHGFWADETDDLIDFLAKRRKENHDVQDDAGRAD